MEPINEINFSIQADDRAQVSIRLMDDDPMVSTYCITISYDKPTIPKTTVISWPEKMINGYSVWAPYSNRGRRMPQWFGQLETQSRFNYGAPVLSLVSQRGSSTLTAALSDSETPARMFFYVDDFHEKDEVFFGVNLLDGYHCPVENYEVMLRIDRSGLSLADSLAKVLDWWDKVEGIEHSCPEAARLPLYSSWYSFHQNPEQTALLAELKEAAQAGFGTVILDDGWQFEGEGTKDYRKSGNWKPAPDKFPDFAGFTRDVHALGLKIIVWFTVPFVGYDTEEYKTFSDRLLCRSDFPFNAGILDIRYPEVRDFLTDTYTRFIDEYDIDGLKLDFIDSFVTDENTPPHTEKMDCETVEEAVLALLTEIREETCKRKPDFLFEYRQAYVGPAILFFGNMIRVGDCAYDSVTNRIGVVDLRMMTRGCAVHSDMLLWSVDETVENCALQLINILFSVPQISVRLTRSTQEQKALLKRYVAYWKENAAVLLDGKMEVRHPEAYYSSATASLGDRRITALYSENSWEYTGMEEDIHNGTCSEQVYVGNPERFRVRFTVCDCLGNTVLSDCTDDAVLACRVPVGGMLSLHRA